MAMDNSVSSSEVVPGEVQRVDEGSPTLIIAVRDRFGRLAVRSKSAARRFRQVFWQPRFASLVLAGADVGVSFVPMLAPVVEVAKKIVEMCEQMGANKRAAQQLAEKCETFLALLERAIRPSPELEYDILEARDAINWVAGRVEELQSIGRVDAFLEESAIADRISDCIAKLDNCLLKLQVQSMLDIKDTQRKFERNRAEDHQELVNHVSELKKGQENMQVLIREERSHFDRMLGWVQNTLGELLKDAPRHSGLAANLHGALKETGSLLPNLLLEHGEVQVSNTPIPTNRDPGVTDYHLGTYLGKDKVVVKKIRGALADNPEWKRRFDREAKMWRTLWEKDHGTYIVPVLGFVEEPRVHQHQEIHMCLVYPYYPNGTAIEYVQKEPYTDHMRILRGIAKGLAFMHDMDFMHGDVRGASVMIKSDDGSPLLTEFGVSKIIEDAGKQVLLSRQMQYSEKWWAPEVLLLSQQSMRSDVFSFGMTVLELLTHEEPWYYVPNPRNTNTITARVADGARPERPKEDIVKTRGLSDALWNFLQECWMQEPLERPDMNRVVEFLEEEKQN